MISIFFDGYFFYENGMDKDFEYWYQKVGFDFDDCLFHFKYSIL
jgi:hypothetical protein